jgi:hypothetical protein
MSHVRHCDGQQDNWSKSGLATALVTVTHTFHVNATLVFLSTGRCKYYMYTHDIHRDFAQYKYVHPHSLLVQFRCPYTVLHAQI